MLESSTMAFTGSTNQSHTMVIRDNDVIPCKDAVIPVFLADFNKGTVGWNIINGCNSNETWQVRTIFNGFVNTDGSPFILADSFKPRPDTELDDAIESPAINTKGMTGLTLKYKQILKVAYNDFNELGIVEVWNGNAWLQARVEIHDGDNKGWWTGWDEVYIAIPDAYANENMKVRFRYMAKYVTAHDYGCVTVEVDRAGAGKTTWLGPYNITNKIFKATPTNNNPEGKYTVTIYYTAAELAGFWERI